MRSPFEFSDNLRFFKTIFSDKEAQKYINTHFSPDESKNDSFYMDWARDSDKIYLYTKEGYKSVKELTEGDNFWGRHDQNDLDKQSKRTKAEALIANGFKLDSSNTKLVCDFIVNYMNQHKLYSALCNALAVMLAPYSLAANYKNRQTFLKVDNGTLEIKSSVITENVMYMENPENPITKNDIYLLIKSQASVENMDFFTGGNPFEISASVTYKVNLRSWFKTILIDKYEIIFSEKDVRESLIKSATADVGSPLSPPVSVAIYKAASINAYLSPISFGMTAVASVTLSGCAPSTFGALGVVISLCQMIPVGGQIALLAVFGVLSFCALSYFAGVGEPSKIFSNCIFEEKSINPPLNSSDESIRLNVSAINN